MERWTHAERAAHRGRILQIKITLLGTEPPVWRRVLVSDRLTLEDLHQVVQRSMGWENAHLHMFEIGGVRYGEQPDEVWEDMPGVRDQAHTRLLALGLEPGDAFSYHYDFGDDWWHELLIEEDCGYMPTIRYPRCMDGARACPPEDVGSIAGYERFVRAINDPDDEEFVMYTLWIGGSFDPEAFDRKAANRRLRRIRR